MNLNKILNGSKSFFATIALVAGWIITFANILPKSVVVYAQAILGFLTLLHGIKSNYGSEFADLAATVGIDASALKNTAKIIIVFFLLGFSLSARAQTYSITKGMDAHSWLHSTITSAAATPDTVLLVGGGGVAFDSITAPFPIEVTVNQKQYIAGETLPVTSPWREIFSVTYVSGDTLVLGSRALYGTLARQWGPGSAVAYSMAGYEASMSSLSFDSITSSKTLALPTTPYHVTVMNATGTFRDTLPTPTVSNNGQRWIFSLTNATDTVTLYQTSVGFNGKGSSGSVTFTQASGNSIELLLWDRNYYWLAENNATTH